MVTVTLADLAPILAAVLGPMLLFALAIMRYQHLDSTKTRDLIDEKHKETRELIDGNRKLIDEVRKENRELVDEKHKETRELIDKNRELIGKNRELIDKNRELLGSVRERLARIEGYLRIWPAPPQPDDDIEAA